MKKIFKIIGICIIVLFVLFCGLIFVQDNIQYPNELYIKMNKINDDKSLIGLSETDIIELLGEPKFKSDDGRKTYTYSAGTTVKKNILVGEYQGRYYDLQITFDENSKVKSALIQQIP